MTLCASVCLSVCLSHVGVLSILLDNRAGLWHRGYPPLIQHWVVMAGHRHSSTVAYTAIVVISRNGAGQRRYYCMQTTNRREMIIEQCRIAPFSMTLSDLQVHSPITSLSNETVHSCSSWLSASRGPSVTAELLLVCYYRENYLTCSKIDLWCWVNLYRPTILAVNDDLLTCLCR